MVYIIGLENHFFQFVGLNNIDPPKILREFVEDFLSKNEIDLIAEEYNKDSCGIGCKEIVCEEIVKASKGKLKHKFVELTLKERKESGIPSEDHASREAHWFDLIHDDLKAKHEILFVCGCAHRKSFRKLVKASGYEAQVVKVLHAPRK